MSVVGSQPKRETANPSYKATKHIQRTLLISDHYQFRLSGNGTLVILIKIESALNY